MTSADRLLTLPDIARLFGVQPRTTYKWRIRSVRGVPFPEPDETFSGRPVWRLSRVVAWGEATGRAVVG